MRHDMSQVLVERPRRGGGWTRKGRSLPFDQLPSKQGMQRPHLKAGCKELNENLKPLRRFLERQVGRPWNTVFSEITSNLRVTSTVQKHVRDHLRDFVRLETWGAARNRYGASDPWPWYEPLYVDPTDGLLKRTEDLPAVQAIKRRRRERLARGWPVECIPVGDRELRKLGGVWYEVTIARLPKPEYQSYRIVEAVPKTN